MAHSVLEDNHCTNSSHNMPSPCYDIGCVCSLIVLQEGTNMSEERNSSVLVLRFSQQYIEGFRYGLFRKVICPKKAKLELPPFPEAVDTVVWKPS